MVPCDVTTVPPQRCLFFKPTGAVATADPGAIWSVAEESMVTCSGREGVARLPSVHLQYGGGRGGGGGGDGIEGETRLVGRR